MKLFQAIAKSLVKNFANLGGAMVGVPIAGDIVVDAWEFWHKDADIQKMRAEIERYARQSVQDALADAQKAVDAVAPQLAPAARAQLVDYLCQVPAAIRHSLRRPDDHTGTTLPANRALCHANDLLGLLPAKLPRFKAGDLPWPHTDLQLEELIGQGGFGEVWKARHLDWPTKEPVALKFCLDAGARRSLENEREMLVHISSAGKSEGIVQLLNTHLRADPPCLEYEYVEGGDLTGLIGQLHAKGRPTPEAVADIVLQLARIVAHAHRQKPPIIHRDLKPANILVTRKAASRERAEFSFKITDFGISTLAARRAIIDYTSGKTKMPQQRMDTLLGAYTPFYASPEQVSGAVDPDPRDDVHALGMIWFQLQMGSLSLMTLPPHWREDLLEAGMSQGFVDVLSACIGRLKDRPSDASDLVLRLEKLLAPPPPKDKPNNAKTRKSSRTMMIAIAIPVLAGCLVLFMTWDRFTTKGKTGSTPKTTRETTGSTPKTTREIVVPPQKKTPMFVKNPNIEKELGIVMCKIPAGKFKMGSPDDEKDRFPDEKLHEVEITKEFYLSATPVTVGQYRRFVTEANYDKYKDWLNPGFQQGENHPVVNVSWEDGKEFCAWLSRVSGKKYDYPTEAQWEYACRAKTTTAYWFGDKITPQQANYAESKKGGTTPVGSYPANSFGLFDMHGNVWQWCSDWYGEDYYKNTPTKDPTGPINGSHRVSRGGCWYYGARHCRAAYRGWGGPVFRYHYLGLRLALVPPSGEK